MSNTALTESIYYTCNQYNPIESLKDITATTDDQIFNQFIKNGSQYQIALSKSSVPIQSIPLTKSNISLKSYEISLDNGEFEGNAFVRQLGSENINVLFSCSKSGVLNTYTYDIDGNVQLTSSIDFAPLLYNGCDQVIIDSYYNGYFLTNNKQTIFIINIKTNEVYSTLQFQHVNSITMDRHDKLYVAIEDETGSVINVYLNQNSSSEVQLTLLDVISLDKNNKLLTDIKTISADNVLVVVSHPNEVNLYDITTFEPLSTFVNSTINNIGVSSSISASGENSGSFCITDDGLEQNQFISTKSPAASGNIFNDILGTKYGLPFNLTQTFLPTGKQAFSNGKCFCLDETNQLKYFNYSTTTGLPTSQTILINNEHIYENCFCGQTEDNVLMNTENNKLYGLNLDNTTNNNTGLIDSSFINGTASILSCDYQPNSNKIISIDSDGLLLKTSAQIYPKTIVSSGKSNDSIAQSQMNSIGFGWNQPQKSTQTSDIIESSVFSDATITIFDSAQTIDGNFVFLGSDATTNKIEITNIHGVHVRSFDIYNVAQASSMCLLSDSIVVYFWDGTIKIYDMFGTVDATISTSITSEVGTQAYIFGGKVTSTLYMFAIAYNKTITIYTSSTGPSGFTQSYYSSGITIGSSSPYLFKGCLYGDETTNKLVIVTSGLAANHQSCKALTQFVFNSTYSSLISAEHLIDNLTICGVDGSISPNYSQQSIYVQLGNYDTNSTGEFIEYNIQYNIVTSTITIPNYIGPLSPIMNVSHSGIFDWYNWATISSSGFTGNKLSVAVSRRNPNRLYVLSSNGKVYTGILTGNTIVFSEFTSISANTSYKSLSITPNIFSYDSTVYCYDLATQNLINSRRYVNQFVSSIAKNDVSNTFTICVENSKIDFVSNKTFNLLSSNGSIQTSFIETKNSVDLSVGKLDIFEFQQVIDQVNYAFQEAFNRLISGGGHMISAPKITMDYGTCIMTLEYSSDWSQPQNKIRFNDKLLRIFKFYSVKDSSFNKLMLPLNSSSVMQTQKSAYLFNQLDKILFTSTSISVNGSYVGQRSTNQVISDIDVIVSDEVNNQTTLYYQPNFLRVYSIGSTQPIQRINLKAMYRYNDGSEYDLMLQPGSAWSAKLQFIKQM